MELIAGRREARDAGAKTRLDPAADAVAAPLAPRTTSTRAKAR
jgi:hypothetical protein